MPPPFYEKHHDPFEHFNEPLQYHPSGRRFGLVTKNQKNAGAFDNATNEGIKRMMAKKGCNDLIIAWFIDFLEHRHITVKYKGYEVQFWPSKGTPQGGVASPWLWNIIVADEIHDSTQQLNVCYHGQLCKSSPLLRSSNRLEINLE